MKYFILLSALCLTFFLPAQDLARKGTFGIQMEAPEDKSGLLVQKVYPNTTASGLGLQTGDLILTVDEIAYTDVYDLVDAVGKWRAGNVLKVKIKRGEEEKVLEGKITGKPLETSAYGEVIYGAVSYDGGMLRSILELPEGIKNPPVLFFLPGVGCGTLDFPYSPNATIKLLVEEFVKNGIAVYRVEKPGMGDSEGTQECLDMDFNYEVAAFNTALSHLKTLSQIDSNQVFLYGHSLGVISAPMIAAQQKVQGIVSWGGIASTWYEYSLRILRDQAVLQGQDFREIDANFRKVQPFMYDFFVNQKTPAELAQNPDYEALCKSYFQGDLYHGMHHYRYFQTINDVDILTTYVDADCPVLTIAGQYDLHAIDTLWAMQIARAVNHYRPADAAYEVIPQTTHHYHTVPSMQAYNEMRTTGKLTLGYMAAHFNDAVAGVASKWILAVMKKERKG